MSATPENIDDQTTTVDLAHKLGLNAFSAKWLQGFVRLMIGVTAHSGHNRLKILTPEHRYPQVLLFMNESFGTVYTNECFIQTPIPDSPEVEFFLQKPRKQMKIRGLRPFTQDELPGFRDTVSGLADGPGV